MFARRLQALGGNELALAGAASGATLAIGLLASRKLGLTSLLVPLALVLAVIVLRKPLVMLVLAVAAATICEGPTFGILTFTGNLYRSFYKNLTPLDGLVVALFFSIGWELVRTRRALHVPRVLILPAIFLALSLLAGAIVGSSSGSSLKFVLLQENLLLYLLLLPIAVANLEIDRRKLRLLLLGAFGIAVLKAVLGLIEVGTGHGASIEGSSTLTYYEPAANWVVMIAILGVFAAIVAKTRPPAPILLASPLLVACLVLSYRRSFWIATVLAIALIFLLGASPVGRRMLVPTALLIVGAILLLGSINFQSQAPIIKRATSLNPSSLEANIEDRYRLDERANVLAEIKRHPITGIGIAVPWSATARTLSTEHLEGRQYVHFAALYYWLKMGILGLISYIAVIIAAATLSWKAWRYNRDPLLRAFGLASLCGTIGLIVLDTTASFTGVDPRFTVIFAAQLGLLAIAAKIGRAETAAALDAADGATLAA
jgi:O-antigen ligase